MDDVSGAELVPEWVVAARAEEMTYFKKLGVSAMDSERNFQLV